MLCKWYVPKFDTIASKRAALRARNFDWCWCALKHLTYVSFGNKYECNCNLFICFSRILNPIVYGDYFKQCEIWKGVNSISLKSSLKWEKVHLVSFVNYYTARCANDSTYYITVNLSYTSDSYINITSKFQKFSNYNELATLCS